MKYKMMILATLTALGLTACQSSTEADTQTPNSGTVIMQNGTTYTVKKGDKLIKTTDDAVVKSQKKQSLRQVKLF